MTVVYDNTGQLIFSVEADLDIGGYILCDVPEGYRIASVNVETKEPVFEKIPATTEELQQQQIDALKEQVAALQAASTQQQKVTDAIIGAESEGETND